MEKSKSNPLRVQRIIWLLQYLRKYSAPGHPVKLREIDRYFQTHGIELAIVDKKTRHKLIEDLATALNSDGQDHPLPWEQMRIYYDELSPEAEERESGYSTITNLYYRQEFTDEEIDQLEEGILFLPSLDAAQKAKLMGKIEEYFATKFYRRKCCLVQSIYQRFAIDRESLYLSLSELQDSIEKKKKVQYSFNGYDVKKKLVPASKKKYTISPYYIVVYGGRYYLLGAADGYDTLSIWRVDLMSELEITNQPIRRKQEVKAPERWDERFPYEHLNMFFDQPVEVTLRVYNPKASPDPESAHRPGYTFLYDWFGPTFRYIRTEETPPYDDIIKVRCSPEAMSHWALQYSERVEVLEPADLREKIAGMVRDLEKKYLEK